MKGFTVFALLLLEGALVGVLLLLVGRFDVDIIDGDFVLFGTEKSLMERMSGEVSRHRLHPEKIIHKE